MFNCICNINPIIIIVIMVDRYKSLLGSQVENDKKKMVQVNNDDSTQYRDIIRNNNVSSERMKRLIQDYKLSTTKEEEQEKVKRFKQEQEVFRSNRMRLYQQFQALQKNEEDPKFLFIKKELLKATQSQMNYQISLNEQILKKKQKLDKSLSNLKADSPQLNNALQDILKKRQQIKQLEESVKQCLQLFNDLRIITIQNTQKINIALQNIQKANHDIDRAIIEIDLAKMRQKRCKRKTCCILILALIIIVLALVAFFGFKFL